MKYLYKNLKHVVLHGIEPFGEKEFNHKIEGGGIKLIRKEEVKKSVKKKSKKKEVEKIINEDMEEQ